MPFYLIASDGKEYGPVELDGLKKWASENRVGPQSSLRNSSNGQIILAGSVPGLFPAFQAGMPPVYGQSSAAYPRFGAQGTYGQSRSPGILKYYAWRSIISSVLGLLSIFAFHVIGVVFCIFAIWRGYLAFRAGLLIGKVALILALLSTVVVVGAMLLGYGPGVHTYQPY